MRYWLTPAADADRDAKIADVCAVYRTAPERMQIGQRTVSTDEMTGVQAFVGGHEILPVGGHEAAR